jgi:hypothetical protein
VLSMKHWGQHYVQYLNRTYRHSGTLWEERFRSCLMQAQDYVLACEGLSVDQLTLPTARARQTGRPPP